VRFDSSEASDQAIADHPPEPVAVFDIVGFDPFIVLMAQLCSFGVDFFNWTRRLKIADSQPNLIVSYPFSTISSSFVSSPVR
jgi:hypothetical protein